MQNSVVHHGFPHWQHTVLFNIDSQQLYFMAHYSFAQIRPLLPILQQSLELVTIALSSGF